MADAPEQRPAPSGISEWVGQRVKLHLNAGGRVRTVEGELLHLAGDGYVVAEDEADFWVPREHVQVVERAHSV
jgi:hypothetical protein